MSNARISDVDGKSANNVGIDGANCVLVHLCTWAKFAVAGYVDGNFPKIAYLPQLHQIIYRRNLPGWVLHDHRAGIRSWFMFT